MSHANRPCDTAPRARAPTPPAPASGSLAAYSASCPWSGGTAWPVMASRAPASSFSRLSTEDCRTLGRTSPDPFASGSRGAGVAGFVTWWSWGTLCSDLGMCAQAFFMMATRAMSSFFCAASPVGIAAAAAPAASAGASSTRTAARRSERAGRSPRRSPPAIAGVSPTSGRTSTPNRRVRLSPGGWAALSRAAGRCGLGSRLCQAERRPRLSVPRARPPAAPAPACPDFRGTRRAQLQPAGTEARPARSRSGPAAPNQFRPLAARDEPPGVLVRRHRRRAGAGGPPLPRVSRSWDGDEP